MYKRFLIHSLLACSSLVLAVPTGPALLPNQKYFISKYDDLEDDDLTGSADNAGPGGIYNDLRHAGLTLGQPLGRLPPLPGLTIPVLTGVATSSPPNAVGFGLLVEAQGGTTHMIMSEYTGSTVLYFSLLRMEYGCIGTGSTAQPAPFPCNVTATAYDKGSNELGTEVLLFEPPLVSLTPPDAAKHTFGSAFQKTVRVEFKFVGVTDELAIWFGDNIEWINTYSR